MIIPAKRLPKYLHSIDFPVKVLMEKGLEVFTLATPSDFQALVEAEAIIGIGSWNRLRHIRLNRPVEQVSELRMKLLNRPPMAAQLHYRDQLGDTRSVIVVKRCVRGEHVKWDNNFSIKELKKNPDAIVSAVTRASRHTI